MTPETNLLFNHFSKVDLSNEEKHGVNGPGMHEDGEEEAEPLVWIAGLVLVCRVRCDAESANNKRANGRQAQRLRAQNLSLLPFTASRRAFFL